VQVTGDQGLVKIAVNGRFTGRHLTGVDRYASELATLLGLRTRLIQPGRAVRGVRGHLWEQIVLPRLVRQDELLWSPANSGPVAVSRQVVSIHDLSALEHPEWFTAGFSLWYRLLLPALVRRARHVLTVSEHSRGSIMRRLHLAPEGVTAVANGVNLHQFKPCNPDRVRDKYRLAERYILFVGSIDPRKNLARLVEAWARSGGAAQAELVIAGGKTPIFRHVDLGNTAPRVRMLGYVPEGDLPALYSGALFFVMPSLFEGFGLTVLEAMACGTAVMASTAGALPEVAAGAALPFDPNSVDEITLALCRLISDEGLRRQLGEQGLARAREFPWERSALQIGKLFEHLA
jgi:glycosyltransferase involved in cell wall biosynthesis